MQVSIETPGEGDSNRILSLEWERVRSFDREVAILFQGLVKQHTVATVTSVVPKEKAKERPIALNTVELMRVASSGLGMGPHHAMQIAEKLYTQGRHIKQQIGEPTCYSLLSLIGKYLIVVLLL